MRNNSSFALAWALLALSALLVGCGDDEAQAAPGSCATLEGRSPPPECESCAQAACGDEYAGFCSSGCSTSDSSANCQQILGTLLTCVLPSCAEACASLIASGGEDGGTGGARTQPNFSCYFGPRGLCSAATVTASTRSSYESACSESGGILGEVCPSEERVGCCRYVGGTQTCVYEATSPALDRDRCGKSGGSWSEP
jgi:hypothetical protein